MDCKRGEIFFADLGTSTFGSEQVCARPVLVVQNNVGNKFAPTVIIVCITSSKSKAGIPTHVNWGENTFLCEQIKTIDKLRLLKYLETVPHAVMERVNQSIRISLGLVPGF